MSQFTKEELYLFYELTVNEYRSWLNVNVNLTRLMEQRKKNLAFFEEVLSKLEKELEAMK